MSSEGQGGDGRPRKTGRPPTNGVWQLQAALAGKGRLDPVVARQLRRLQDAVARDLGYAGGVVDMPALAQAEVIRWSFTNTMAVRLMQIGLSLGWKILKEDMSIPPFLAVNLLAYSAHASRIAGGLGLRRTPLDVPSLQDYLAQRYPADGDAGEGGDPAQPAPAGSEGGGP